MFPDITSAIQAMLQYQAFSKAQETWRDIQRERRERSLREYLAPLIDFAWFCIGKMGIQLSKIGKKLEESGQKMTWLAMRKKSEKVPGYYN